MSEDLERVREVLAEVFLTMEAFPYPHSESEDLAPRVLAAIRAAASEAIMAGGAQHDNWEEDVLDAAVAALRGEETP